jgi:predicted GH43/DUF377 family glycosyl hydrolase
MNILTSTALLISFAAVLFAVIALWISFRGRKIKEEIVHGHRHVKRSVKNPIMSPQEWNEWETMGTFNPAALQDKNGRIHLLYRALGSDGVSRIGYASGQDGLHFDERLSYPVYAMQNPRNINLPVNEMRPDPVMYPSGGSWGGSEDPRLVQIDDTVYMSFNAFDGWDFIRIAVVKIKADDFFNKKWRWSKPLFISPKGQVNKNWVIFPEKINGKLAILHSITPEVQIEYVNRLEDLDWGKTSIKSNFSQRKNSKTWDAHIRGAGPPPIKTEAGWLVLYHAMDKKDPHIGYKLGALLLDLNNPSKVIARSPTPIMTPSEWYENDWKPGVVYACGAAVKHGILYVYYGGGDKHIGVAQSPLKDLLEWLIKYGKQ